MPVFIRKSDGNVFPLTKKLTTLGSSPSSDVVLTAGDVASAHAHVLSEADTHVIAGIDGTVVINGKKRSGRYKLAAGDVVTLGAAELAYSTDTPKPESKLQPMGEDRRPWLLAGYRRLHQFSQRCAEKHDLDELLSVMLDDLIDVLRADKGFVILLEEGKPKVRVARGTAT